MNINENMPLLSVVDNRHEDDTLHVGTIVTGDENKKVEVKLRKTESSHQVTTVTSSVTTSKILKKSQMQSLSLPKKHVKKSSSEVTAKKRLKIDKQHQVTKSSSLLDIKDQADQHVVSVDKFTTSTSHKVVVKASAVSNSQKSRKSGSQQDLIASKASSFKSNSSHSSHKSSKSPKSSSISITSSSSVASSSPGSFRITPKSRSTALENLTADNLLAHDKTATISPVMSVKRKKKKAGSSKSVENVVLKLRTSVLSKQASSESAPPLTAKDKFKRASKSMLRLQPSVSQDERIFFSLNPTSSSRSSSTKLNHSISSTDNSAPSVSTVSQSLDETKKVARKQKSSGKKDLLSCPIRPGEETFIEINKGNANGLGLSIVGGRDSLLKKILVHSVYADGAAAKDGRLWPGDELLKVNEFDIRGASHDEAIQVLLKCVGRVRLLVLRDENRCKRFLKWLRKSRLPFQKYWEVINNEQESQGYDIHEARLVKKKGLGLSIIGRRNHPGVYVKDLIEGGVAWKEGTIRKGDHILMINNTDVKFASQETVASLLKNAKLEVTVTVGRSMAGEATNDDKNLPLSLLLPQQPEVNIAKEELLLLSYTAKDREEHQIRFVEIHKLPYQPLGVTVAGGLGSPLGDVPIFVAVVNPGTPAVEQLKVGDIILSVNGRSTDGKTHDDVVQMLKGSDDSIVLMQVREGGDEVKKLNEYLKLTTSGVNEIMSQWDPNLPIFEKSDKPPIDIELRRSGEGLGITISGGYGSAQGNMPIFIKSVASKGAAADEGRLKAGDQILSVNGEELYGYTHEEAAEALKRKSNLIILHVIPK